MEIVNPYWGSYGVDFKWVVETERNGQRRGIAWQFTARDAHEKLVEDQTTLAELIIRALQEGRRSQCDIWRQELAFSLDQVGWVVESKAPGPVRPFRHETVPSQLEQ